MVAQIQFAAQSNKVSRQGRQCPSSSLLIESHFEISYKTFTPRAPFTAASGFLYNENPALGAGGSKALKAMGQDKKTPFDVE